MSSPQPVRIGVVGTGAIGAIHADRVASDPNTELAVLCGLDDGAPNLAAQLGAPLVTDFRETLKHDVDGLVIATPNHLHTPMATFFLELGLPVLVEKPIAENLRSGLQLCAVGSRTGTPILVGHHRRHNPLVNAAKQIVANEIGDVMGFMTAVSMRKPDSYYDAEWRRSAAAGPLLVNLVHEVDLIRFVVDDVVAVQAATRRLIRPWDFDDTAGIVLHLRHGAVGTVFISESTPSPWSWESSVSEGMGFWNAGRDYARFMGSRASLAFPSLTLWSYEGAEEPGWSRPLQHRAVDVTTADPYSLQIDHFAHVIADEVTPIVDAEDGLRSLAVVEAVIAAGRTGEVVDVDALINQSRGSAHHVTESSDGDSGMATPS